MFMGEYHHNIDDKNRLVIPSNYRSSLGETFVITRGLEKCLYIYTVAEWQKIVAKLASINITPNQAVYAELTKECVIIGVNDRLEIWSKENWDKFNDEYSEALENVAEHLFSGEDNAL